MTPMLPWLLLPLAGAVIGYVTNWLAIRMLFHPQERRMGMQGLLPRRQRELARTVGRVVADELLPIGELVQPLRKLELAPVFTGILDRVVQRKLAEYRNLPLIGSFLTPDRLDGLRDAVVRELVQHQPEIVEQLAAVIGQHVDIARMAEEKVAGFDLDTLERLVHRVAKREFRAIELWGAVLGLIIGLAQASILTLVP